MKKLENLEKGIFQTRQKLLSNENIRKLVYYDNFNALSQTTPSYENAKPHIVVSPIFDATKEPFNKNTIISISINRASYDDESKIIQAVLKINVLTRSDLWEIEDNKIRTMELSNLIIDEIDTMKFTPSHKASLSNVELAILDENINGYSITFLLFDGSGEVGSF